MLQTGDSGPYAVRRWRYEQAIKPGLTLDDALRFAESDGDLETLRRLVKQRCDPHVAAEIVS